MRCLSDQRHPQKIAFIQCVGSRDLGCDNGYCSSVCCMYAIKEAMVAKEHDPDCEITVYYMDLRTQGKDFDAAKIRAEQHYGIKFVRARVADVMPWGKNLKLTYSTMDGVHSFEPYDMVVLSVGSGRPGLGQTTGRDRRFRTEQVRFLPRPTPSTPWPPAARASSWPAPSRVPRISRRASPSPAPPPASPPA